MKTFLLITGSGNLMILTSHESLEDQKLLDKLQGKGIDKFIGYEVPYELARQRYGGHFDVVVNDLYETDDLRILDFNGTRIFGLFSFSELGEVCLHESTEPVQDAA